MNPIVVQVLNKNQFNDGRLEYLYHPIYASEGNTKLRREVD